MGGIGYRVDWFGLQYLLPGGVLSDDLFRPPIGIVIPQPGQPGSDGTGLAAVLVVCVFRLVKDADPVLEAGDVVHVVICDRPLPPAFTSESALKAAYEKV